MDGKTEGKKREKVDPKRVEKKGNKNGSTDRESFHMEPLQRSSPPGGATSSVSMRTSSSRSSVPKMLLDEDKEESLELPLGIDAETEETASASTNMSAKYPYQNPPAQLAEDSESSLELSLNVLSDTAQPQTNRDLASPEPKRDQASPEPSRDQIPSELNRDQARRVPDRGQAAGSSDLDLVYPYQNPPAGSSSFKSSVPNRVESLSSQQTNQEQKPTLCPENRLSSTQSPDKGGSRQQPAILTQTYVTDSNTFRDSQSSDQLVASVNTTAEKMPLDTEKSSTIDIQSRTKTRISKVSPPTVNSYGPELRERVREEIKGQVFGKKEDRIDCEDVGNVCSGGSHIDAQEDEINKLRSKQTYVYEPSCKDTYVDKPCSKQTYVKSEEEWPIEEPKVYKHDIPAALRDRQIYDAMFIHAGNQEDEEIALKLAHGMEENILLDGVEKPKVYVQVRDEQIGRSKIDEMDNANKHSTFKFVIVSKYLTEDKWARMMKDEALVDAIEKEELNWSVIPVHTQLSGKRDYEVPFGLKALNGIIFTGEQSKYFYIKIGKSLNSKLSVRREREDKLEEEKEKALSQIRERKMDEFRQKKHKERMEQLKKEETRRKQFVGYQRDEENVRRHMKFVPVDNPDTVNQWKREQQAPPRTATSVPQRMHHNGSSSAPQGQVQGVQSNYNITINTARDVQIGDSVHVEDGNRRMVPCGEEVVYEVQEVEGASGDKNQSGAGAKIESGRIMTPGTADPGGGTHWDRRAHQPPDSSSSGMQHPLAGTIDADTFTSEVESETQADASRMVEKLLGTTPYTDRGRGAQHGSSSKSGCQMAADESAQNKPI